MNEIVINGIPEKHYEDKIVITWCIGHELKLKINDDIINYCYRIKSHRKNINLDRIVKFVMLIDEINLLKVIIIKRGLSTKYL